MSVKIDWLGEKVYSAEWVINKKYPEGSQNFKSLKEMQNKINSITEDPWFKRRWPFVTDVKLKTWEEVPTAFAEEKLIYFPDWSRDILVLLHELSHICNRAKRNRLESHGVEFVAIELQLVGKYMGPKHLTTLKQGLKNFGFPGF